MAFSLGAESGFSWIGEYDITADELLSGTGGNTETKTEQAERLILDLLADGKEMASEDIVKAAAEAGISERTVQNAKRSMGGILGAKTTDIWFDEKDPLIHIRTHNTALKKRLLAYSRRYPAICQQTDADPETGCMEFDIEKGRLSFRLTAPYSEERRRAAQRYARENNAADRLK